MCPNANRNFLPHLNVTAGNPVVLKRESSRRRGLKFAVGGPLLSPATGYDPAPFDTGRLDRVDPGKLAGAVHRGGYQHPPVEAGTAGAEALQAVDSGQTGFGVIEGKQFPVHGAPGARYGPFGDGSGGVPHPVGQARLSDHIGQRISGAVGEDVWSASRSASRTGSPTSRPSRSRTPSGSSVFSCPISMPRVTYLSAAMRAYGVCDIQ